MARTARPAVRTVADRLVGLGMVTREKAAAVLEGIAQWNKEHLDEELDEANLLGWLPEFGVAVSVHGEDVDFVESYYRFLLQEEVSPCTGGAVVVSDVVMVRGEEGFDKLHFLRNGEPVWWALEHQSEDYVDQGGVSSQIGDVDPGGDDSRMFYEVQRKKRVGCDDDVYVLATPEQARVLHDELDMDFVGLDRSWMRRGEPPTAEPDTVDWYMQEDRRTMTETEKAFLGQWLSDMDAAIAAWRPDGFPADFSLESLDTMERLVAERFASSKELDAAADDPFVVGAVRYLGETLIRNGPGHWGYRDRFDTIYDRIPAVRSNTPSAFQESVFPLHELGKAADRGEPGVLAGSIEHLHYAAGEYAEALEGLEEAREEED